MATGTIKGLIRQQVTLSAGSKVASLVADAYRQDELVLVTGYLQINSPLVRDDILFTMNNVYAANGSARLPFIKSNGSIFFGKTSANSNAVAVDTASAGSANEYYTFNFMFRVS